MIPGLTVGVAGSARYLEEEVALVVNKQQKFSISFNLASPPPEDCVVSAMVVCEDPEDVLKLGPVRRCKKHMQEEENAGMCLVIAKGKEPLLLNGIYHLSMGLLSLERSHEVGSPW